MELRQCVVLQTYTWKHSFTKSYIICRLTKIKHLLGDKNIAISFILNKSTNLYTFNAETLHNLLYI